MKYSVDVTIDLPRERVVELFDNADNLKKWMEGLESFEHISGEPGQPGAKSRLKFKMGKREIEMIETVTANTLPDQMDGTYEAKGVFNTISNKFTPLGDSQTKLEQETEFEMKSFMMKLMAFFMPGAFKKQTCKYLEAFKAFAEAEGK